MPACHLINLALCEWNVCQVISMSREKGVQSANTDWVKRGRDLGNEGEERMDGLVIGGWMA